MAKPKLKPTSGNVIVQPLEKETKTASGIYLPDSTGEKPQKGKVLAVGASVVTDSGKTQKSPVKVGETVIYKKWGGNEVTIDGIEYMFVRFEDILAIEG